MLKFEWDNLKSTINYAKHGVDFDEAKRAFDDPLGIFAEDFGHSRTEPRFFFYGKVAQKILTVRFTIRSAKIRIIGAGYWRKGKAIYEHQNEHQNKKTDSA